jgi:hypothetical protein
MSMGVVPTVTRPTSAAYAPLRQAGVSASALAQYDVHLVARRNERAAHPDESLRLYWRYPVWDDDGRPLTRRLAAVDGRHPRSQWDGPEPPDRSPSSGVPAPHRSPPIGSIYALIRPRPCACLSPRSALPDFSQTLRRRLRCLRLATECDRVGADRSARELRVATRPGPGAASG